MDYLLYDLGASFQYFNSYPTNNYDMGVTGPNTYATDDYDMGGTFDCPDPTNDYDYGTTGMNDYPMDMYDC